MSLVQRFQAYADDFEHTYADDDWSRLEQYFTEDAAYSTPTSGVLIAGREAALGVLRGAVSGFDRLCDTRVLVTTKGPSEHGNEVVREWTAKYTLSGAPDLDMGGRERAVFRGDRIELLEVTLPTEVLSRFMQYVSQYILPRSA